jgi:hypothetical protein
MLLHCCGVLLLLLVAGCSSVLPTAPPRAPDEVSSDPTPLAKCTVSASHTSPLVTEWPASEKAHLESLVAQRTVAVEYSGCELRIVDGCELPGQYVWRRTTLATDTIEIADADELYTKLPIGAIGLEGELERSGRLAVQTTVAGQLRAEGGPESLPRASACRRATHFISAISVGSFRLLSGADASGSGSAQAGMFGGGVKAKRSESVLREAGARIACDETTDEAPNGQCASPIQLFLAPLGAKTARTSELKEFPSASEPALGDTSPSVGPTNENAQAASEPAPKKRSRPEGAVEVAFPAPEDPEEVWTLRRPGGKFVCRLPCREWIGPASGYYLQREPRNGARRLKLDVPASFPHPVGTHVTAEFQTSRGNRFLAGLAMWVSVPAAAVGAGLITWGVVQSFQTCKDHNGEEEDCFPGPGFLFAAGLMEAGIGAAGIWWFTWSREERFETHETIPVEKRAGIGIGLGSVYGTF